jgi:glyoxylase-like metal-dependent hydrolase (beta-lactamase superfamily II)
MTITRESPMEIEAFFDEATSTLTYVVWEPHGRAAVIIDPVLDYDPAASSTSTRSVERVAEFLTQHQLTLHWVLETHAHADHLSGSQWLRARFGCKVAIGRRICEVQAAFAPMFDLGRDFPTDGRQFDRLLDDGETLTVGALQFRVMTTPGHTPACLSYLVGDAVFTGDALFMHDYGTGRCDFPGGSAQDLYDSVQRLYALPEDTRVFVGHDYQPGGRALAWQTTIDQSRRLNPQLRAETRREQFLQFRNRRDATLSTPRLLYPSVQININAGRLLPAHANGQCYLHIPIDLNPATPPSRDKP